MTAIFNATSFPSITTVDRATIAGQLQPPGIEGAIAQEQLPHGTDPVVLTLSDGTSPTIFDSKWTALRCLRLMGERGQWMLQLACYGRPVYCSDRGEAGSTEDGGHLLWRIGS